MATAAQQKQQRLQVQKQQRLQDLSNWWKGTLKLKGNPPADLRERWLAKGASRGEVEGQYKWDLARAMEWMRNNKNSGYMGTPDAQERLGDFETLYRNTFGPDFKLTTALKKAADIYARGTGNPERVLRAIFEKTIRKSRLFQQQNPGYDAWLKHQPRDTDILTTTGAYSTALEALRSAWNDQFAGAATTPPMPTHLIMTAMEQNLAPNSAQFAVLVQSHSAYASSASYGTKMKEFQDQWSFMFPDRPDDAATAALADKYARGNATFDEFFKTQIRGSRAFTDAFPEFSSWEKGQAAQGVATDSITVSSYFKQRQDYMDLYTKEFTDGSEPPPELLRLAMEGNWSDSQFNNYMRTMPQFASTDTGIAKATSFDTYWKKLFGDAAAPDAGVRAAYIASNATDPSSQWETIKGTDSYKQQFPNWAEFAKSQTGAGNNVTEDPMAYKEYNSEIEKAFATLGMQAPDSVKSAIFSSGVAASDLGSNANLVQKTQASYETWTGTPLGVGGTATAIGTSDKLAGADIRNRLAAALEAHKAWAGSEFAKTETSNKSGLKTQSI